MENPYGCERRNSDVPANRSGAGSPAGSSGRGLFGETRQRGGKRVTAFAVEGDLDINAIMSNTFKIQWPPKGGKMLSFPEIDRAA
jgi:predicted NUDIX family NTP pyrophosphohydrolase